MKIVRGFALFLTVLLWGAGCKKIETTTTVYPDGSCLRKVVVEGDSAEVVHSVFPLPLDSTWQIEWFREGKVRFVAEKRYDRISEMSDEYASAGPGKIAVEIRLEKRFRWFFTRWIYHETYRAYSPFLLIPVEDRLTGSEIEVLLAGEDNDEVEKKFEDWVRENVKEYFYRRLLSAADSLGSPAVTREILASKREALLSAMMEEAEDASDPEDLCRAVIDVLGKDAEVLHESMLLIGGDLLQKFEMLEDIHLTDLVSAVEMPGLILDTNARTLEGNRATWEVGGPQFHFRDYTMFVESRVLNRSLAILTPLVLAAALGLLVVLSRRRQ